MLPTRVLFALLAVLGAVQAAPRGHCSAEGGGERNCVWDGNSNSTHTKTHGGATRTPKGTGTALATPSPSVPPTTENNSTVVPSDDNDVTPSINGSLSAAIPSNSAGDCKCGYVLSAYNDAYLPFHHASSFGAGPEGPMSASTLSAYKLVPSAQGEHMGVAGDAVAVQDVNNIRIKDGVLELVVPGGQTGAEIKSAQVVFGETVTGGVFTMDAKIDSTPGTCQSIFTFHKWIEGEDSKHDEQDIELLGDSLLQDTSSAPKGIQLTSYDPATEGRNDNRILPYPSGVDPVNEFHKYTIAWVPSGTQYAFDGKVLDGPTKYTSVNPSNVILNHWSSASSFTKGPPTKDVVMGVKSLDFYYATEAQKGMLAGCSLEQACRV